MPSFSERLEAAIGSTSTRPAPAQQTPKRRRQFGLPWERAGMSKNAWLRWRDERHRQQVDEALANATPEALEIMRAIPGCLVSEVRLVPPPEELPALPDLPDDVDAPAVDEAGMSVTDGDVTLENDDADQILDVAAKKVSDTTCSVPDENETPPIVPSWPRQVSPLRAS